MDNKADNINESLNDLGTSIADIDKTDNPDKADTADKADNKQFK